MEKLQVAVCEDSAEEQESLLTFIQSSGVPAHCSVFASGEAFLADFQPEKYDLIFMDIYMGGISGIDVITAVRQKDEAVLVAFATTSLDHTLESYRLGAVRYLEKPVCGKAVRELLELALLKKQSSPRLLLCAEGGNTSVPFDRILFIEQQAHTLSIHLLDGKMLSSYERLDDVALRCEGQGFFRCHKSYLVNLANVRTFDRSLCVFTMSDGQNVHIRRQSMTKARQAYETYLFGKARGNAQ